MHIIDVNVTSLVTDAMFDHTYIVALDDRHCYRPIDKRKFLNVKEKKVKIMGKRQISAIQQVPLGCTNEIYYKAYDWLIEFMLHGSQLLSLYFQIQCKIEKYLT